MSHRPERGRFGGVWKQGVGSRWFKEGSSRFQWQQIAPGSPPHLSQIILPLSSPGAYTSYIAYMGPRRHIGDQKAYREASKKKPSFWLSGNSHSQHVMLTTSQQGHYSSFSGTSKLISNFIFGENGS